MLSFESFQTANTWYTIFLQLVHFHIVFVNSSHDSVCCFSCCPVIARVLFQCGNRHNWLAWFLVDGISQVAHRKILSSQNRKGSLPLSSIAKSFNWPAGRPPQCTLELPRTETARPALRCGPRIPSERLGTLSSPLSEWKSQDGLASAKEDGWL